MLKAGGGLVGRSHIRKLVYLAFYVFFVVLWYWCCWHGLQLAFNIPNLTLIIIDKMCKAPLRVSGGGSSFPTSQPHIRTPVPPTPPDPPHIAAQLVWTTSSFLKMDYLMHARLKRMYNLPCAPWLVVISQTNESIHTLLLCNPIRCLGIKPLLVQKFCRLYDARLEGPCGPTRPVVRS